MGTLVGSTGLNEINNLELGLQVFKCQNCGKMCTIKRHLKLHEVKNMDGNFNPKVSSSSHCCGKDFSSYQELSGVINDVKKSLECCNCELRIAVETLLREHLLKKHGKLSLVEVIPDRGKLDSYKPIVTTNVESSSIQVMMASCEKCSCTSMFRSYFGLHIQTSHEPSVSSLFSVVQDEIFTANAVDYADITALCSDNYAAAITADFAITDVHPARLHLVIHDTGEECVLFAV